MGMGMGADMGLGLGLGIYPCMGDGMAMSSGMGLKSMGFSMSACLQGVQSGHLGLNEPAVSTGRRRGRGQARSQLDQDRVIEGK